MAERRRRRSASLSGDEEKSQHSTSKDANDEKEYSDSGSEYETGEESDESRESGDGEEAPNGTLDDDEDVKNPAYIPRKGAFYLHDSRSDPNQSEETTNIDEDRPGNKKLWSDQAKWLNDGYNEAEQGPKSTQELIALYGYDIRKEDKPPAEPPKSFVESQRGRGRGNRGRSRFGDFVPTRGSRGGRSFARGGRGSQRRGRGGPPKIQRDERQEKWERSTDPTPVESNAEKTAVDMPTATAPTEPVASQDARQSQDVRQDPMAQKPLPKTASSREEPSKPKRYSSQRQSAGQQPFVPVVTSVSPLRAGASMVTTQFTGSHGHHTPSHMPVITQPTIPGAPPLIQSAAGMMLQTSPLRPPVGSMLVQPPVSAPPQIIAAISGSPTPSMLPGFVTPQMPGQQFSTPPHVAAPQMVPTPVISEHGMTMGGTVYYQSASVPEGTAYYPTPPTDQPPSKGGDIVYYNTGSQQSTQPITTPRVKNVIPIVQPSNAATSAENKTVTPPTVSLKEETADPKLAILADQGMLVKDNSNLLTSTTNSSGENQRLDPVANLTRNLDETKLTDTGSSPLVGQGDCAEGKVTVVGGPDPPSEAATPGPQGDSPVISNTATETEL